MSHKDFNCILYSVTHKVIKSSATCLSTSWIRSCRLAVLGSKFRFSLISLSQMRAQFQ